MGKMGKYPSDVSVSKNCIDANLKMVERQDPDNIPRRRNGAHGQNTKLPLKYALNATYLAKKEKK